MTPHTHPSIPMSPEPGAPLPAAATAPREYLAFKLDTGDYGIDILRVQEIRAFEAPTRLAHAPGFVKGVINLRGSIVPIIDLRLKFGLDAAACDAFTVVIVVQVGHRVMGLVVDAVDDVVGLDATQHRPVPLREAHAPAAPLQAIGVLDSRLLMLLDIDKLLVDVGLGLAEPTLQ